MARMLLGVSGGIAAYKALELVRLATKAGHAVRVVQTRRASASSAPRRSRADRRAGAGRRVRARPARGAFPGDAPPDHDPLAHLELVANADVFLVAPASANTMAKLAARAGRQPADRAPRSPPPARCSSRPAMNDPMWEHPATRANLALLRERGVTVLEPGHRRRSAPRASGAPGACPSRPSCWPPSRRRSRRRRRRPLDGLRVLVSAGGTREPIDAVRFVGNRSSGRMGFALAEEAAARGAGHGGGGQRRAAAQPAA